MIFSELELATLLNRIINNYAADVEEFLSMRNLIDILFDYSKKLEVTQGVFWASFFMVPFFLSTAVLNDPTIKRLCLTVSFVTSIIFYC